MSCNHFFNGNLMKKRVFTRIEGLIYKMKVLWSPFLIEKGVVKTRESAVHRQPEWKPVSNLLN